MWSEWLRQLLVGIGVIPRLDLVGRFMDRHPKPDELPPGLMVIVKDGGHLKWACFRCPGGCGEKLKLSLNQSRRPRWVIGFDLLNRPTLTPSVHQLNACRCHFVLKKGVVNWCVDSGKRNA